MTSYPALRELAEKARPYSSISDEMRAFRFEAHPTAILDILDKYDAALAEIDRLKDALTYYALEVRYDYDNDCCPDGDNPSKTEAEVDLLADDRGGRAREALRSTP